jgi:hypothetical protein
MLRRVEEKFFNSLGRYRGVALKEETGLPSGIGSWEQQG